MIPTSFSALVQAPYSCARVVAHNRDSYRIANEEIETRAELSGKFRFESAASISLPVVGDYVQYAITGGTAIISLVLPRNNLFARRGIYGSYEMQAISANIDMLFLVMAVNRDFNLRRLERYLVAASAYEIPCAVALSKIDLSEDPASFISAAQYVAGDVPVLALSALSGMGLDALSPYRGPDKTIAFVGSSGVGKSTLINTLLNQELLDVGAIREDDDRGRHTTSRRCLLFLNDGTAIIDTPGMREFALADAEDGVSSTFTDVAEISQQCKFRDCQHNAEPGCAVRELIDVARLQSWRKLGREAAFEARKSDRLLAAAEKQRWKAIHKENRRRQQSR